MYEVIDRHSGKQLTDVEILYEANRDHSDQFEAYTLEDFKLSPEDVFDWIDPQYYEVKYAAN
jgi:hypothetical protein